MAAPLGGGAGDAVHEELHLDAARGAPPDGDVEEYDRVVRIGGRWGDGDGDHGARRQGRPELLRGEGAVPPFGGAFEGWLDKQGWTFRQPY